MTAERAIQISEALYWDWNATTPPHPSVVEAVAEASLSLWANSSSQHQLGRAASSRVEGIREHLAARFGARPRDAIFTGSGTEANNLALQAADTLITSRLEHPSIVRVAEARQLRGLAVVWLQVERSGQLAPAEVERALGEVAPSDRDGTVVCVAEANHETGVIQPIEQIAQIVASRGSRLHVDMAQSFGKLVHQPVEGRVSFTVVGHKIRGPKGVAALIWKNQPGPMPVLLGGSQERGLRPGTVSVPLVVGLGVAVSRLKPARYQKLAKLRNMLEAELAPYATVHGASVARLPHVSNLGIRDWTGERLVAALDVRGLCVSTGSACSVGTAEPSAAVLAMLGSEAANASVRISIGETCTIEEINRGAALFVQLLADTQARRSSRNA